MKKKYLVGIISGLVLLTSGPSFSEDVELGVGFDAARQGYYGYAASVFGDHADKGNGQAQFNMALMYHSGLGVARDEKQAVEWYEKAAQSGHEMAQAYMAAAYEEGWFGLERDAEKARYWSEQLPQYKPSESSTAGSKKPVTARKHSSFGWSN